MPVPAWPVTSVVVIQSAFALGSLEGLLNLPALPGNVHKSLQSCLLRGRVKPVVGMLDRKSTRLNSSHLGISYAVFCLKKKKHITSSHFRGTGLRHRCQHARHAAEP